MINYMDYIEVNLKVMLGKPVVTGTRITVEAILEELATGKTPDDLIKSYPKLDKESILASLAFAADSLRGERKYPIAI
jgi:uncharacterized protein (DUF433 family)